MQDKKDMVFGGGTVVVNNLSFAAGKRTVESCLHLLLPCVPDQMTASLSLSFFICQMSESENKLAQAVMKTES